MNLQEFKLWPVNIPIDKVTIESIISINEWTIVTSFRNYKSIGNDNSISVKLRLFKWKIIMVYLFLDTIILLSYGLRWILYLKNAEMQSRRERPYVTV